MSCIQPVNAKVLIDLFNLVPDAEQRRFLSLLAQQLTAEALLLIAAQLSTTEKARFSDGMFERGGWEIFTIFAEEAVRLVREFPQLSSAELTERLHERVTQWLGRYDQAIIDRERATLKEERDRHSDPATIRRNLEICNLRRTDQKLWTLGRLSKQFKVTPRMIRKVLKDEPQWRQEASQVGTN